MSEQTTDWNEAVRTSWIGICVIVLIVGSFLLIEKGCDATNERWKIHAERGDFMLDNIDGWMPKEILSGVPKPTTTN